MHNTAVHRKKGADQNAISENIRIVLRSGPWSMLALLTLNGQHASNELAALFHFSAQTISKLRVPNRQNLERVLASQLQHPGCSNSIGSCPECGAGGIAV